MVDFLWIGSALGALLGLLHGTYLFQQVAPRARARRIPGGPAQGLYYGLWAFTLWTLFGSYVLALWLLGVLAYPIVRLFKSTPPSDSPSDRTAP